MPGNDASLNLAIEELLFRGLPEDHPGWFLLWQNSPSLIIGRYQQADLEIDRKTAGKEGIPVIRRITGGGAVYHDFGNLNFSFIRNSGDSLEDCLVMVQKTLFSFGLQAQLAGRNDIQLGGKKISGASIRKIRGKTLCHGTLLIQADYEKMAKVLTPAKSKLVRHGISSVKSRISSLSEYLPGLTLTMLKNRLLETCCVEQSFLEETLLDQASFLADYKYRNPFWNLDAHFSYNRVKRASFDWGTVKVRLFCKDGKILSCRIQGDFIGDGINRLEERLIDQDIKDMPGCFSGIDWESTFSGCIAEEAIRFFTDPVYETI